MTQKEMKQAAHEALVALLPTEDAMLNWMQSEGGGVVGTDQEHIARQIVQGLKEKVADLSR